MVSETEKKLLKRLIRLVSAEGIDTLTCYDWRVTEAWYRKERLKPASSN